MCVDPCNLTIRKHGYKIKVLSEVESKVENQRWRASKMPTDKSTFFLTKSRLVIVGEGIVIIAYVY